MSNLKDVIAYVLGKYPFKSDLSNARVTKIIYLADWHHAIHYGKQLSEIRWYFDNYGPFVNDVITTVQENSDLFAKVKIINMYGSSGTNLKLKNSSYKVNLTDDQKKSLDYIINVTQSNNWSDFIKLVYSTFPIMTSERYSYLDLISKAAEYKEQE